MKYAIEISKNTWYIEIISSYKYSSVYLQCNYALCFQACYRQVVTDGMRGKSFRFIHEIRIIIINVRLIPIIKVIWLNLLRRKQFINWSSLTDFEKYLKNRMEISINIDLSKLICSISAVHWQYDHLPICCYCTYKELSYNSSTQSIHLNLQIIAGGWLWLAERPTMLTRSCR